MNWEILHKQIAQLPNKYRDVVVLCHLEGKSRAQAASILDCTTASVKAALARGRKLLRRNLIRHGIAASSVLGVAAMAGLARGVTQSASSAADPAFMAPLWQTTLNLCNATNSTGHVSNAAGPVVRSLIQKEVGLFSLSLMQNGLAVAVSVAVLCFAVASSALGTSPAESELLELAAIADVELDPEEMPEIPFEELPPVQNLDGAIEKRLLNGDWIVGKRGVETMRAETYSSRLSKKRKRKKLLLIKQQP